MQTLKDIMQAAGIPTVEETEEIVVADSKNLHRGKTITERPKEEISLQSVNLEDAERKKVQADPTDDLVFLPKADTEATELLIGEAGYLIWCDNTLEMWYAPDKVCLDSNFIFREDIEIIPIESREEAINIYKEKNDGLLPGVITRKKCYILDNPASECYEVYYDSNYPTIKYGKATPSGMFVYVYENRFHRDMAIMELDNLYSSASAQNAKALVSRKLKGNEAIIISDGAWMKEVSSCSCVYIDNVRLIKQTHACNPSEVDQAVLISEITGAIQALTLCKLYKKKAITYYYDNTSIVNVFRNRKTEYIEEIKAYKELLEELDSNGYRINFIELHPKTGEEKDVENKALCFFHNTCDRECREISDIFKKDYVANATLGNRDGKSYDDVKAMQKKPQQNKGNQNHRNGPGNQNNRGGYNKRY